MNFVNRFVKSLYDFDRYEDIIKAGSIKAVINVFLVSIGIIFMLSVPLYVEYAKLGGITGAINKYVPEFNIKDGILTTDKVYRNDIDELTLVVIDTNNTYTEMDLLKYESGVIITKDKILMKSVTGDCVAQSYDTYEKVGLTNKEAVLRFVPVIKVYMVFIFITLLIFLFVQNMFFVGVFTLVANVVNICIQSEVKLLDIFLISCYAIGMPTLLKYLLAAVDFMINSPFSFSMPTIIYVGLIGVYCYLILKTIKESKKKAQVRI